MRYFPLFFDLNHKPVLVVGGGEVASRKVDALVRAGARVTIVSPQIEPFLQALVEQEQCIWEKSFYHSDMMKDYVQAWATTDNPDLNHQVYQDATDQKIMVNVVDDLPFCDFITPSMIERGRVQIAISSGGASPVLIRNIREKMESVLAQNLTLQAEFAASKRNSIKKHLDSVDGRRRFWEAFFAHPLVDTASNREALEDVYQTLLTETYEPTKRVTWHEFGQDVELLSIKSLRLMQQAQMVLYPSSCPFEFVDLCRRDAARQTYNSVSHLSNLLEEAARNNEDVCVFVPEKSHCPPELNLLLSNAALLQLANV
ncbi:siroheme synthase [Vibrio tapetis]|uniref:precorrin-2 dehydrogenase n=1 Tax=Vibrio tapetis subsp. tapetis TaxID=1671868 RepID=A0A2N8ZA03_9VIBR|nr:siroheme synthase [Vibrio tapetis]SON48730.1 putative Siroheme synthase / Precorrin-2 oxidase [Vibrio tapetis subsp. tapetis]